jgi:hypothetical protein
MNLNTNGPATLDSGSHINACIDRAPRSEAMREPTSDAVGAPVECLVGRHSAS